MANTHSSCFQACVTDTLNYKSHFTFTQHFIYTSTAHSESQSHAACLWTRGGSWSTNGEPAQTQREHANSTDFVDLMDPTDTIASKNIIRFHAPDQYRC